MRACCLFIARALAECSVIIAVPTRPSEFRYRQFARLTWASGDTLGRIWRQYGCRVAVRFVTELQAESVFGAEVENYGDVVSVPGAPRGTALADMEGAASPHLRNWKWWAMFEVNIMAHFLENATSPLTL